MLIDLVVVSALVLFGTFLLFWLASPAVRARIEQPKHVFLEQARAQDKSRNAMPGELLEGGNSHE